MNAVKSKFSNYFIAALLNINITKGYVKYNGN